MVDMRGKIWSEYIALSQKFLKYFGNLFALFPKLQQK